MNPKSYRSLAHPPSSRVRCPVCHEVVYSRAGIHPQCAVIQSDPPRPKRKPQDAAPEAIVGDAETPALAVEGAPTPDPIPH